MPKIKYIGKKPTKQDNVAGTGKTWNGAGDVQEVSDLAAERLLKHSDAFALDDGAASKTDAETESEPEDQFAGLSKEELHALAKERGVEVHHAAGAAKVAEALRAATKTDEQ